MCARLICNESKYCHITPLLVDLHWLPVKFRIEFKILLTVFKIFRGLAPLYLSCLIISKSVSRYNLKGPSQPHLCFCLYARVWLLYFNRSMSK